MRARECRAIAPLVLIAAGHLGVACGDASQTGATGTSDRGDDGGIDGETRADSGIETRADSGIETRADSGVETKTDSGVETKTDSAIDAPVPRDATTSDHLETGADHDGAADARVDGAAEGSVCDLGYVLSGAICTVMAPRPIAPLSTATVTSRRPMLRWALAAGTDGARVELCSDRSCTAVLATVEVSGDGVAPAADLPSGVVYWRVFGRKGGDVGVIPSPTWEIVVGTRSSSIDASWGTVLDVDGDGFADVVSGAPLVGGRAGRVHLFQGSSGGLEKTPTLSLTEQTSGLLGWAVASAGDVNGDGYTDVIVGAPESDAKAGRAYLYLGSAGGLAASSASILKGPDGIGGFFGAAVTSAGDVNGDGYADVAISASDTTSNTGTVYVYLGGPTGLATSPATSFVGPDGPGGHFGDTGALASAGDLNGDGYQDLAVGAPGAGTGRIYVYSGGPSGFATPPLKLDDPNSPTGNAPGFGRAFTGGDFDGDGYADLVVADGPLNIYPGGSTGLSSQPATSVGSGGVAAAVASAGDVDRDGYVDLVVGIPDWVDFTLALTEGEVLVCFGGSFSFSRCATRYPGAPGVDSSFGFAVAGASDVDGDGHADVLVGAPAFEPNSAGAIFLYRGAPGSLNQSATPAISGPDGEIGNFGFSLY